MKTISRKILKSVLVLAVLLTQQVLAGREAEYSDKYPLLTLITPYGQSVFFSGYWHGRAMVVRYVKAKRWSTFIQDRQRMNYWEDMEVRQSGHHIVFKYSQRTVAFDLQKLRWTEATDTQVGQPGVAPRAKILMGRSSITVQDADTARTYDFPLPSANAYRRWRELPLEYLGFDVGIGSHVQIGDDVWFINDYYDGEGSTGIGGLGIFDLKARRYGVYRNPNLAFCSTGHLIATGDTLIVATGDNGEYGLYGCSGLVLVKLKTGSTVQIPAGSSLLGATRFHDVKLINRTLWMITENGIAAWELDSGRWFSARAETLVVDSATAFYRRATGRFSGGDTGLVEMARLSIGEKLRYEYWGDRVLEASGAASVVGWVDADRWMSQDTVPVEYRTGGMTIWKDSLLTVPYHHIAFSNACKLRESGNRVLVRTHGGWVHAEDVHPVFATMADTVGVILYWTHDGTDDLTAKERALRELDREQAERSGDIPVLDTLLFAKKGEDLIDKWGWPEQILNGRWMPHYSSPEPTGIEFRFSSLGDKSFVCRLTLADSGMQIDGRSIKRGDTWVVTDSSTFTVKFRLLEFAGDPAKAGVIDSVKFRYTFFMVPKQYY